MGCGSSSEKQAPPPQQFQQQQPGQPNPYAQQQLQQPPGMAPPGAAVAPRGAAVGGPVPPITADNRRVIGKTAQSILDNSVQFRTCVETVAPLSVYATAPQLMADGRPISELFRGRPMPTQVAGAKDSSFEQMINTMKLLCQTDVTNALLQTLAQQGTVLDEGQKARYGAQVAAETNKAITQMTNQYVGNTLAKAQQAAGSRAPSASVQPPRRSPRSSPSNNTANNTQNGGVVLPAGKWVKAEGSPFYWSDEEKLFYHPDSTQFFDPETNKWYDPENDEWYDEDDQ